jgi:outer membrane lipoprotein-sorting protein
MTDRRARRLSVIALAVLMATTIAWTEGPDPTAALKAADQVMYPQSFSMTASIATERPGQESTAMQMEVRHKAGLGSFIELLAPARTKGTRFLQTESALWMYSPKSGSRTPIRLSPRESFQGSAFSNNDVGDSSWANDYAASLAGSATVDSPDYGKVDAWIISGKALRHDVPYGEIRIYMKKDDLLPLKIDYFAKSGLPLKTMELSDYAQIAGRLRPRRLVMASADGTGEKSIVTLSALQERNDLPDAMFNQSWLTR